MRIMLRRNTLDFWNSKDPILLMGEVAIEFPDEFYQEYSLYKKYDDKYNLLLGKKFKYKLGDGKHKFSELNYEPELIPAVFMLNDHP